MIAREFILREKPDIVVAVVSAANLERSLYLVSELICLPAPLVLGLNMMDVAEQEGIHVEPDVLQAALGVPVIALTATRAAGVRELLAEVERTLSEGQPDAAPARNSRRSPRHHGRSDQPDRWLRTGTLPDRLGRDETAGRRCRNDPPDAGRPAAERWQAAQSILEQHDDAMLAIASGRYEWIGRMMRAAVTQPRLGQISLTDRLDRWATHPVWGLFILAGILGLVFWLTFTLGAPLQDWLAATFVTPLEQSGRGLAGELLPPGCTAWWWTGSLAGWVRC